MFGLPNPKIVGAALVAASLVFGVGYGWGRWDGSSLTEAAVDKALKQAREDTDNAINELADEADRARVRRNLCLRDPRGMSWSFANNECIEVKAEP